MRAAALGLMLMTVAGCSGGLPSPIPTATILPASPEPATPAPAPTTAGAEGCRHPYQPVIDGASWSYQGSGSGGDYSRTDTIDEVTDDSFLVETQLSRVQYFVTWECEPEGLVNMRADGGMFEAVFSGPDSPVFVEVLSSEGVTLPASISQGDEWEQQTSLMFSSKDIASSGTITHEAEAIGMESVTVPAGTFQAMRIDVTSTMDLINYPGGEDITFEASYWLAPGVGLVRMAGGGEAMGVEFVSEIQLVFSNQL